MGNEELRNELKELHSQLENSLHKAPLDKDMLGHVMGDIVRIAEGEDLSGEEGKTLQERLEDKLADFEMKHPTIAEIVRDVMDVLAKLGI
jgi:hypothetical protein